MNACLSKKYVEHDQMFRMVSQGNCNDAIFDKAEDFKEQGCQFKKACFIKIHQSSVMSSGLSL